MTDPRKPGLPEGGAVHMAKEVTRKKDTMHMGRVPEDWDAVAYLERIGLKPVRLNYYGQMVLTDRQSRAVTRKLQSNPCRVCRAKKGRACR